MFLGLTFWSPINYSGDSQHNNEHHYWISGRRYPFNLYWWTQKSLRRLPDNQTVCFCAYTGNEWGSTPQNKCIVLAALGIAITSWHAASQMNEIHKYLLLRTTFREEKTVSNSTVAYKNHRSDENDGTNCAGASFEEETRQVKGHEHRMIVQQKQVRRAWNEQKRQ